MYDRGSGGKLDVLPAPDVIAEFQVLASHYPPDYGMNSGGTVLMQLKSGTKAFVAAFGSLSAMTIWSRLLLQQAGKHSRGPELRLNIFGGDIGGPVVVPHLYDSAEQSLLCPAEWRSSLEHDACAQNTLPAELPHCGGNCVPPLELRPDLPGGA